MRSFAEIDRAACRAKATVWVRPVVRAPFLRSPGQPLPGEISLAAQARFGHDFSGVRVHTERQAAASARRLGARAYALADQLVFDEGEYSPATAAGRELLRHELAHVAQWKAGGSPPPTGIVPVNTHDSPPEREAGRTATHDGAASPLQNPAVQCALKKPGKVPWGTYEIEMSDSGKGASYTHVEITFTPDAKGPVTDEIQFIQIAKPALPAKMFTAFHPDQADLEQYTTQADPTANVEGGYHVDIDPRGKHPRTKPSDPPVSPNYPHLKGVQQPSKPVQSPGGLTLGGGGVFGRQYGYNHPGDTRPAIMVDDPGGGPMAGTFSFETAAHPKEYPFAYGTVAWSFAYDPLGNPRGITGEKAEVRSELSPTFAAALRSFQKFYR